MAVDGSVVYKVDYDTKDAKKDLKSFKSTLNDVGKKAGDIGKTLTTKVTAPIAAAGGVALAGFMKVSEELDAIGKTAAGVNATAEGLQALQFAGRKAGIESDKMSDVLKKVQELTSRNAEAFQEAGITITDMNDEMLSSDKIFVNIMDSLSDMSTEQRNATLLALGFTEELVAMNKAMEDSAGFAANMEKGMENAVTDETIQKFEQFNDKIEDLKMQMIPIGIELAERLLPYLEKFADWMEDDGIEKVGDFIVKLADFTEENWLLIASLAALGPALQVFSAVSTFATNVANLATKLRGLTTAAQSAQATLSGGTAGGAALTGGGAAALGYGAIGAATYGSLAMMEKIAEENVKKYGPGGSGAGTGLTSAERKAMFGADSGGIYGDVRGLGPGTSIRQQSVASPGVGTVQLNIAEMSLKTELSQEKVGQVVDEVMTEVGNELTRRNVVAP